MWRIVTIFVGIWRQYLRAWRINICQNLSTIFVSPPVKYLPLLLTHPRQTIILCLTAHGPTDPSIQQINMRSVSAQNYSLMKWQIYKFAFHSAKGIFWRFLSYLFVCLWEICLWKMFTENIPETFCRVYFIFWAVWSRMIEKNMVFRDDDFQRMYGGRNLCLIDFSAFLLGRFGGKSGRGDEWLRGARAG